jgi:hypothetical protein
MPQELDAAAAVRVDCLVGIYHACHRELCAHQATSPFKIVNFLAMVKRLRSRWFQKKANAVIPGSDQSTVLIQRYEIA